MASIEKDTAPDIFWIPDPITREDIQVSTKIFRDPNPPHHCPLAAKKTFGDDATDIVATGALVLGLIGGVFPAKFGDGTMAEEIKGIKLSRCFCPNDYIGFKLEITRDRTRTRRFLSMLVTVYRNRNGVIAEACRKPLEIAINCDP